MAHKRLLKSSYLPVITTAADSGVSQHWRTSHTSVTDSVTCWCLPSVISRITFKILICKPYKVWIISVGCFLFPIYKNHTHSDVAKPWLLFTENNLYNWVFWIVCWCPDLLKIQVSLFFSKGLQNIIHIPLSITGWRQWTSDNCTNKISGFSWHYEWTSQETSWMQGSTSNHMTTTQTQPMQLYTSPPQLM